MKGLQTLPNAVEEYLGKDRVRLGHSLVSLDREEGPNGMFVAVFDTEQGKRTIKARSVSLTSPTRVTTNVARKLVPEVEELDKVYSPPVASVTLAYKKSSFKELPGGTSGSPLRGFGHLLPRKMGIRSLGTIWSSSLFPGRAPKDWEVLLTYIGGARDKGISDMEPSEIVDQVKKDVSTVLLKDGVDSGDIKVLGIRVWDYAIPQYNRGHYDILEKVTRGENRVKGLFLGGNYRTGVAFGDCVQFGLDEAKKVSNWLKESKKVTVEA